MRKLVWTTEDTLESIIKTNNLKLKPSMEIFHLCNDCLGKFIAFMEMAIEQERIDYQKYLESPEYKEHKSHLQALGLMSGVLAPYFYQAYEDLERYNKFVRDANTISPKEYGMSKRRK